MPTTWRLKADQWLSDVSQVFGIVYHNSYGFYPVRLEGFLKQSQSIACCIPKMSLYRTCDNHEERILRYYQGLEVTGI